VARHPRDPISLVLGLLLIAVAGIYLLDAHLDLRWVGPAALIAVGLVGLLASTRRRSVR
jgi:hypothetical protein